ncbi:MlaD family protein [Mycobacteroides abscessus]|uniref:MlaD family protein n=1 Tax=Mycobacteroides abscessus TaxID=36809 RepID=UPI0009447ECF|nr:MlaD family protein [Mycobacteroides abscessus]
MQPPTFDGPPTIQVVLEFSSALNLPAGAKITYEGNAVGSVRSVALEGGVVAVTANLDARAHIPAASTAAIVQDTVLGDSYVSLGKPTGIGAEAETGPALAAGARIPVGRTQPPASIEDMMTSLSSFIGSGSIQRLQAMVRNVNAAMPQTTDETREAAASVARNLRSLATNSVEVDRSIDTLGALAASLKNHAGVLDDFLSPASVDFWTKYWLGIGSTIGVLAALGDIFAKGAWLIPLLDSMSTALEQTGPPGGGSTIDTFTNQTLVPFLLDPTVEITDVMTPDGVNRTADTRQVLAKLGALR